MPIHANSRPKALGSAGALMTRIRRVLRDSSPRVGHGRIVCALFSGLDGN